MHQRDRLDANSRLGARIRGGGFTLIELIVVLGVIAALVGIGFPAYIGWKKKSYRMATEQLVGTVALAARSYQQTMITLSSGSLARVWDIDGDRVIDGDPRIADAAHPTLATVAPSSYGGFLAMTGFDAPRWAVDPARHIIDRWRRPLRIAWSAKAYGGHGVGVWSLGPDGLDGTPDDITSWSARGE